MYENAIEKVEDKIVVKRICVNSLPLPIEVEVINKDGTTEVIRYEADVWKNGVVEFEIELLNMDSIKQIELNTTDLPDVNPEDNKLVM